MRWLELKVPPLLLVLAFAAAMLGASRAVPALTFAIAGHGWIAAALLALGIAVAAAGVAAFRRRGTTLNPMTPGASTTIVAGGIYRHSRNPMYLGFALALAAWAVFLENALAALLLPAFVAWMTRFQIRPEERALLAKFGAEYARYLASVRRWL